MSVLQTLVAELDRAMHLPTDRLPAAVTAALGEALTSRDWLPPEMCRAHPERYARNLLHADTAERYALLAIAWGPGQHSPLHGHYCWCGVGVYSGELVETHFRDAGAHRAPVEVERVCRRAGDLSFDQPLTGIHRIDNRTSEVAVSLHVYGVSRDRIATGVNRIVECPDQAFQPSAIASR